MKIRCLRCAGSIVGEGDEAGKDIVRARYRGPDPGLAKLPILCISALLFFVDVALTRHKTADQRGVVTDLQTGIRQPPK